MVLSVTVLDVMMNHVDGGSARAISEPTWHRRTEVCLWNFDDDTMSTRRCVASRNAAFTMSGGPYTHMSLMSSRPIGMASAAASCSPQDRMMSSCSSGVRRAANPLAESPAM